ncbi:unnamed protein product [Linum trigynum]|uniref:Uncharacterized protein n=1 Tax=Linum trigynum TaxID=586398 RepID=A0AAV2E8J5_9ROSI
MNWPQYVTADLASMSTSVHGHLTAIPSPGHRTHRRLVKLADKTEPADCPRMNAHHQLEPMPAPRVQHTKPRQRLAKVSVTKKRETAKGRSFFPHHSTSAKGLTTEASGQEGLDNSPPVGSNVWTHSQPQEVSVSAHCRLVTAMVDGSKHSSAVEDSSSKDDAGCFEVRSQRPTTKLNHVRGTNDGLVRKVAEAGGATVHTRMKDATGGLSLGLDEYGSSLTDHEKGGRKQTVHEMDGDIVDNPTPKKQFIEEDNSNDQVEEANLEWSQSDK